LAEKFSDRKMERDLILVALIRLAVGLAGLLEGRFFDDFAVGKSLRSSRLGG
jgi:hypothetical protein